MAELRVIGDNVGYLPILREVTVSPDTSLHGPVLLGSIASSASFAGCMRMLHINDIAINLNANVSDALNSSQFATAGCPREENCYLDPCANGGTCVSTWNDYSCSCLSEFMGTDCSECKLFYGITALHSLLILHNTHV